ncbi:MAG: class I SAM-dependent methyltransferase [Candidatus Nanoarchaeia archaeon]
MTKVQKLYSIMNSSWYNQFKSVWNRLVAKEAEEQLADFLKKNVNKDTDVLDLGCGTALNLKKILKENIKFKSYTGMDFSQDMLNIARNNFKDATFIRQDIRNLNSKKYDIIICTWVLSHLPEPAGTVNKAQKKLKLNGKMFLTFLSRPKWYVRCWFNPLAKYVFQSRYVLDEEVKQFKNVRKKNSFSADITTVVHIGRKGYE